MNQKDSADSSAPMGCSAVDGPQLPLNAARSADAYASLGDVIECRLHSQPGVLRAVLSTPEAVAYGNDLIASGRWWKMPRTADGS